MTLRVSDNAVEQLAEGKWFEFNETTSFKIAAHNNKRFKAKKARIEVPFQSKIRRNKLSDEERGTINIKAMAGTILLDWKGVAFGDDERTDYSDELAVTLMQVYTDVTGFIMDCAMTLGSSDQEAKELGKPSTTTSAGTTSTEKG